MPYDPLADRQLVKYLPKGWEISGGVLWGPEYTKVITGTRIPPKRLDPPPRSPPKETVRIFPIRPGNPVYDSLRPWAIPGKQPFGIVVGKNRPTNPDFRSIKPVIYHTKFSHIEPPTRLKWIRQVQTFHLNNYAKGFQTKRELAQEIQASAGDIPASRIIEERHQRQWGEIDRYLAKYYDGFSSLDAEAMGADLAEKLSEKKFAFVQNVLEHVSASHIAIRREWGPHNSDDVSLEILKRTSTGTLKDFAQTQEGRDVVLRMVRDLDAGSTFPEEVSMMQKGMRAVTSIKTGKPPTIEVITYSKGLGDVFGNWVDNYFRGGLGRATRNELRDHTTLVINDYAYSFEPGGWSGGHTKDSYLGIYYNRERVKKGRIYTLRVDPKDVARLQNYMLSIVGTDQWGIKGVCTSSTGKVLQRILDVQPTYSPLGFRDQLEASGLVIKNYPTYIPNQR